MSQSAPCPDCAGLSAPGVTRRTFIQAVGAGAAVATVGALPVASAAANKANEAPEPLVKKLYDSLTPQQKAEVCFDWNYTDDRGLLRTHVSNNWNITDPKEFAVGGPFFTGDQQELINAIFFGLYNPDWHKRILKQLQDDAGGYGKQQTIAIFGQPGTDQFEFVMTGRHLTIRCDGNSAQNIAFGGPLFYGHAANEQFNEPAGHPDNVFWHQAQKANALFQMLDGKQRKTALVPQAPAESAVAFRGASGAFPGIPVSELTADQKAHAQDVLKTLIDPYRGSDREEVLTCLNAQGGLDKCSLAFYQSGDIGNDGVWDIWRLEGPSFVWHFRGAPHVHVWVNVASDPTVKLNAKG